MEDVKGASNKTKVEAVPTAENGKTGNKKVVVVVLVLLFFILAICAVISYFLIRSNDIFDRVENDKGEVSVGGDDEDEDREKEQESEESKVKDFAWVEMQNYSEDDDGVNYIMAYVDEEVIEIESTSADTYMTINDLAAGKLFYTMQGRSSAGVSYIEYYSVDLRDLATKKKLSLGFNAIDARAQVAASIDGGSILAYQTDFNTNSHQVRYIGADGKAGTVYQDTYSRVGRGGVENDDIGMKASPDLKYFTITDTAHPLAGGSPSGKYFTEIYAVEINGAGVSGKLVSKVDYMSDVEWIDDESFLYVDQFKSVRKYSVKTTISESVKAVETYHVDAFGDLYITSMSGFGLDASFEVHQIGNGSKLGDFNLYRQPVWGGEGLVAAIKIVDCDESDPLCDVEMMMFDQSYFTSSVDLIDAKSGVVSKSIPNKSKEHKTIQIMSGL